jgi:hypothetical protein
LTITTPAGESSELRPTLADASSGRYAVDARFDEPGVYRVSAEARRAGETVGTSSRWVLVGGADRELAEPRLNEEVLRRIARATGGSYLRPEDAATLPALLASADTIPAPPRLQELWQRPWVLALIISLLTVEWMLRRRWGLR